MLNYLERLQRAARAALGSATEEPHVRTHYRALRIESLDSRLMLSVAPGDTVVNFNFTIGGQQESVQVELFNSLAPQTVANFLNYVDSGAYNNTFIHRTTNSNDGLSVVQGGGYSVSGNTPITNSTTLTHITTNPPVTNEYSATEPDAIGTLAMALTSNQTTGAPNANSGTSEWFFNVSDNSQTLGPANQQGVGYTVFGQVLGNGMQVIDQIDQLQRLEDFFSSFSKSSLGPIPLANFNSSTATEIDANNLVVLNSVTHPSISGTVFADVNANGTQDAGDQGLSGWTVYVDKNNNGILDSGDPTAVTDASGNYSFSTLAAGTYNVRIQPQVNWTETSPVAGSPTFGAQQITLTAGQSATGSNFGEALALPTPATPVLPSQFDSGSSDSDHITNITSPQFTVSNVIAGETVQLLDAQNGNALIGQAVATGTTATITPSAPLSEGPHLLVAVGNEDGFTSGQSTSRSVTIDTTPPHITSTAPTSGAIRQLYTYSVTTDDPGAATFSLSSAPAGALVDPATGALTWTPTNQQVGFQHLTVVTTDLAGNSSQQQFTVGVAGPPLFAAIPDQSVNQGSTLLINPSVASINPLTYSLGAGAPADVSINPQTGQFTWVPSAADAAGVYHITFNVVDSSNRSAAQVANVTVVVPPVFAPIADQTIDELAPFTLPLSTTDQGPVAFSLVGAVPAGATVSFVGATPGPGIFTTSAGQFSWTPAEGQDPGPYTITVQATGAGGLTATQTFHVAVNDVDVPPVLDPVAPVSVVQGGTLSVTVTAHDAEIPTPQLLFSLDPGAPAGATINAQTGVITWTVPSGFATGPIGIPIRVSEVGDQGLSATETVTVNVGTGINGFELFTTGGVQLGGFALGLAVDNGVIINGPLSLTPFGASIPGGLPAQPAFLNQLAGLIPAGSVAQSARGTGTLPAGIVDIVIGSNTGVPFGTDAVAQLARYGQSSGGGMSDQGKSPQKDQTDQIQKAGNFETFQDDQSERDQRNDSSENRGASGTPTYDQSSAAQFWGPANARWGADWARAFGRQAYRAPRGLPLLPALMSLLPAINYEPPASAAEGSESGNSSRGAAAALAMPLLVGQIYERDRSKPRRRLGRWLQPLDR